MHGLHVGQGILVDKWLFICSDIWNFSGKEELATCEHMERAKHPIQT